MTGALRPARDPLAIAEEDFLASVQAYLLEDTERIGRWPWEEMPEGEASASSST